MRMCWSSAEAAAVVQMLAAEEVLALWFTLAATSLALG